MKFPLCKKNIHGKKIILKTKLVLLTHIFLVPQFSKIDIIKKNLNMNNGLQKISLFTLIAITFLNINYSSSNEIGIAPLIKLDEIAPSYDESDENMGDFGIEPEINTNKSKNKDGGNKNLALIGILNKITAQVSTVEILSGEEVLVYDLKIFNRSCHISSPEDKPLVAVYLVVDDLKGKNDFSGWMVKDLPSISSMEHPLYDIWVKDCT